MKQLILPENLTKPEKEAEVIPFSVVTGGKGGSPSDWLSPLPEGTIFLTRQKKSGSMDLLECHVLYQLPKSVFLLKRIGDQEIAHYVDPAAFCQQMELYEIVRDGNGNKQEELSSGSVHTGAVETPERAS